MKQRRKTKLFVLSGIALVVVGVLGVFGWRWQAALPLQRVEVSGNYYADDADLVALAGVDTAQVLFEVDPVLVEDRVLRHPWVQRVSVQRLPTGTLAINVLERAPVVLVVDDDGTLSRYLDGDGYQMPLLPGTAFDVPLLRGLKEPYNPVMPVQQPQTRSLLATLADLKPEVEALVSEVELQENGSISLRTTPIPGHGTMPVQLGHDQFRERLATLYAFWKQAVLPQPGKTFRLIDLRFKDQVVTRGNSNP